MFTITLLTRLLDQIRSVTGLPEAIEQKITALATLNRAAWATLPDRRADAETAAVAALIEAASTGKPLPAHVEAKVTEAASLDASSDARNRLVRRAVEITETNFLSPLGITPTRLSPAGCARRCTRHWNAFLMPPD